GLLACGSPPLFAFPVFPVASLSRARRLQLRGQLRPCPPMASAPNSLLAPVGTGAPRQGQVLSKAGASQEGYKEMFMSLSHNGRIPDFAQVRMRKAGTIPHSGSPRSPSLPTSRVEEGRQALRPAL